MVSDWGAVEQLVLQGYAPDKKESGALAINSGMDMDMCDNVFIDHMEDLVIEGKVSEKTIDEAVRRVLRVKFQLGLFENPYGKVISPEKVVNAEKFALIGPIAAASVTLPGSTETVEYSEGTYTLKISE